MSKVPASAIRPPSAPLGALAAPEVRLEVRSGAACSNYSVGDAGFLLGSVPGCDLRLPGPNLPPLVALLVCRPDGVFLRKLAPIGELLVNGRAAANGPVQDGDKLTFGVVEIVFRISQPAGLPVFRVQLADSAGHETERLDALDEREQQLARQLEELETDRSIWYRRRQEIEEECRRKSQAREEIGGQLREREDRLTAELTSLQHRESALKDERAEVAAQRHELAQKAEDVARREAELSAAQQELADIRQQFHVRYRQRRDRLVAMHEAVKRAGRKVQERKHEFEWELSQARTCISSEDDQRKELRGLTTKLGSEAATLEAERQRLQARELAFESESARLLADMQNRERHLAEGWATLEKSRTQHQVDLARLDRLAASLEQKQKQMQRDALEVDRRYETLQRDSRDLEEQAAQLDECHGRHSAEQEDLERQRRELEAGRLELAQKTAAIEGQQAMLATLRTRLERMRDEHRQQEQALTEQRERQDAAEAEIQQRLADARRIAQATEDDELAHEQQRKQFEERRGAMEAAVAQLRQTQERLQNEAAALQQRRAELDVADAGVVEQAAILQARNQDLDEQRQRLAADRQTLAERESAQVRAEQVLVALQEQLRKRADDLASRQREAEQQTKIQDQAFAALELRRQELAEQHRTTEDELAALKLSLEQQLTEVQTRGDELDRREEAFRSQVQEYLEVRGQIDARRTELDDREHRLDVEQTRASEMLDQARAELESLRSEAASLGGDWPDQTAAAEDAIARLNQARGQLREHLAEIHGYVRQGREDLESLRESIRGEIERLGRQEQALHDAQDEHRLAVAGFRQQLIDWQGEIDQLRRGLARGEERVERRQAEVAEQARQLDDTSRRLAEQAGQLEQQQRDVSERRQEVDRHLSDMREWYRRKIRELAGIDADATEPDSEHIPVAGDPRPTILSMAGTLDPGDQLLSDSLRSLDLIDPETLAALLAEARRQRRSLRQLLLAGDYLTLFQLSLIEAGNIDGLVLGPVRVVDRLDSSPREAVYRGFDPRYNREVLLRHLAESEADDAARPDEFRQRFAVAAELKHPNIAETYEVLDVSGRPAVLQEWLTGTSSNDWPALAAVPGVWYRLLCQAARALQHAHETGLVHGNIHPGQFVFTPDGALKLCGFGEPAWLAGPPLPLTPDPSPTRGEGRSERDGVEATIQDDLLALGRCGQAWSIPTGERRGPKARPLPDSLQAVLQRLCGEAGDPILTATALLEELDTVGRTIPANAAAWERFVRHVREQSLATPLRRSA